MVRGPVECRGGGTAWIQAESCSLSAWNPSLGCHLLSQPYLSGPVAGHIDSETVIWKLKLVGIYQISLSMALFATLYIAFPVRMLFTSGMVTHGSSRDNRTRAHCSTSLSPRWSLSGSTVSKSSSLSIFKFFLDLQARNQERLPRPFHACSGCHSFKRETVRGA